MSWTQAEAIALARKVEAICPEFGCHVALTGGLLYKDGPRKDCDLLFYRIRQEPKMDVKGLLESLEFNLQFKVGKQYGWVAKTIYKGKTVDLFFPEQKGDNYP